MARRQYLIGYDICDDKRRTRVFKMLMGQGDHVQFSVFLCSLSAQELVTLRGRLTETINSRDDQIIIIDLGETQNSLEGILECLGKRYNPISRVLVV